MVVKNCENCRHKEIVPDGPGSSTTKLICKNLWMMCYGDVRTTDDIFECIGCVGWYPEIVAPAENLDRLVSFEEIRQVTEFLGLSTTIVFLRFFWDSFSFAALQRKKHTIEKIPTPQAP